MNVNLFLCRKVRFQLGQIMVWVGTFLVGKGKPVKSKMVGDPCISDPKSDDVI